MTEEWRWWEHAKCQEIDPNAFFPAEFEGTTAFVRKMVCHGCPVRLECLEEGLSSAGKPFGAWGGLSESQVVELWRQKRLTKRSQSDWLQPKKAS